MSAKHEKLVKTFALNKHNQIKKTKLKMWFFLLLKNNNKLRLRLIEFYWILLNFIFKFNLNGKPLPNLKNNQIDNFKL